MNVREKLTENTWVPLGSAILIVGVVIGIVWKGAIAYADLKSKAEAGAANADAIQKIAVDIAEIKVKVSAVEETLRRRR